MEAQNLPSRKLLITSITLATLLVVTTALLLFTRTLSQKVSEEAGKTEAKTITPTPKEPIIYLDLPRSFPRDMVLPPRAKVTVSGESENDWTATFLTTTPLEGISDYYIKELPKAGWLITNQSQGGGLTVIYAESKEYKAIIAIGKGDLGITVSMTILKGS